MCTGFSRSFLRFFLLLACVCAGGLILPVQAVAKDYVSAFLSWSGTRYRIVKARQTVAVPVNTADFYESVEAN